MQSTSMQDQGDRLTDSEIETLRFYAGEGEYGKLGAEPPAGCAENARALLRRGFLRFEAPSYSPTRKGDEALEALCDEIESDMPRTLRAPIPVDRLPMLERVIRGFPCFSHLREGRPAFDDLAWEVIGAALERMSDRGIDAARAHKDAHAARLALDFMSPEGTPARFDLVRAWEAWDRAPAYRAALISLLSSDGFGGATPRTMADMRSVQDGPATMRRPVQKGARL